MLGDEPFLVVSSDIITDYPLASLPADPKGMVHLVLVENPEFHPHGDFGLRDGYVDMHAKLAFYFCKCGCIQTRIFFWLRARIFSTESNVLFPAIERGW